MKFILLGVLILLLLLVRVNAQVPSMIEIADGTKIPFGTTVYSTEAEIVSDRVKNSTLKFPIFSGKTCTSSDQFRITDSAEGTFTAKDIKSKAYLYSDCSKKLGNQIQGIIVVLNEKMAAHFAYPYISDVKLRRVDDLDGNGLDELAVFSHEKTPAGYRTAVRIVEFGTNEIKRLGSIELQNDKDILTASRLYAEKGDSPRFYLSKLKTDGSRWKNIDSERRIELHEDTTNYVQDKSARGIMKHLWVWTFFLQMAGFAALLIFVVYEFFAAANSTDADKAERANRKAGRSDPISDDHLPKLEPINCEKCGAGVPLQVDTMACVHCGTRTTAPADYFDVAEKRSGINAKIREAAAYIKRARFLGSPWVRYATLILAIWLLADLVAILVLFTKGNLEPYLAILSSKVVFGAGTFSNCFWIVALLFGFAIWAPNLKKMLPTVELPDKFGEAENAQCSQCGGAIQYGPDDLAAVCGYCGVETYRAKLAWKLRNLTNHADKKANFSLIEARKSVEDAVWEITGTPRTFAFLLILVAIFGGIVWLLSAIYDKLPSSVKDIFEFISDILGAF